LLQRGMSVPGDVALVGFDDIEDGRFSTPTLTTIRPDKARIAALSVDLLAQRLAGDVNAPPRESHAGWELVVRESTSGSQVPMESAPR
ncbi:MAG: substrate-binding domain-containing protein, partial [Stackebrandtia sp.]